MLEIGKGVVMNTILQKVRFSKKIIEDSIKKYPKIEVATSFGKDSMVVLHLTLSVHPKIGIFTVMTQFKPPETIQYKDRIIREWDLDIKEYRSSERVPDTFPRLDPEECCRLLKVEPTRRAIQNLDAWMTGLRKAEGRIRGCYNHEEERFLLVDGQERKIAKINPILDWTETDVWKYLALHQIPVHPWYALGYRSLGCSPCTDLIDDGDAERAGRWKGTPKVGGECGIHTKLGRKKR